MPSMTSLYKRLLADFSEFNFVQSDTFLWSAQTNTVHIDPNTPDAEAFSLHELSHALLGHNGYSYDIDLIKLERDAWQYAVSNLGVRYGVIINEHLIQDNLDTYREWLHARSTCPSCNAAGIQAKNYSYRCLGCGTTWRANEARLCSLRRYPVINK